LVTKSVGNTEKTNVNLARKQNNWIGLNRGEAGLRRCTAAGFP